MPAPPIEEVLPALLEFIRGTVFVAHNAPYDSGFLRAACAQLRLHLAVAADPRHGRAGPPGADPRRGAQPQARPPSRNTSAPRTGRPTARSTTPSATVDVLHALIGRLGSFKVNTIGEAIEFPKAVTPTQRRKRHLAEGLPHAPGVYIFRAARRAAALRGHLGRHRHPGAQLLHRRARSGPGCPRCSRAAERVEAVECAHALEAEVRELRLIAAHAPPYNRRSKFPERVVWLKLTDEAFPRLSVVRALARDDDGLPRPVLLAPGGRGGRRRRPRRDPAAPVHAAPLDPHRRRRRARSPSWAGAPRPASTGSRPEDYDERAAAPVPHGDHRRPADRGGGPARPDRPCCPTRQRYEEAAVMRGRLVAVLRAAVRMQRLARLTGIGELVAARRHTTGGWELAIVRHGRLAAAGVSPPRVHPRGHDRGAAGHRRDGPAGARARSPARRPRRPSGSCPGWSIPPPGWWRRRPVGRHPHGAPSAIAGSCGRRRHRVDEKTHPFAQELLTDSDYRASLRLGHKCIPVGQRPIRHFGGCDGGSGGGRPRA